MWNDRHLGERRGGHVTEFSGDEMGHEDEGVDAAVAASTCSRFLECTVLGLEAVVVIATLEVVEDAGEVRGEHSGKAPGGVESAAPGPVGAAVGEGPGLVGRSGRCVNGSQGLLDARSPRDLEVGMLQTMDGLELRARPSGWVLGQTPARTLRSGLPLDLGASHVVERLAAEFDDLDAAKAEGGLREVVGGAGRKRAAHVRADMREHLRLTSMHGQVVGEPRQAGLVPAGRGTDQTQRIQAFENREILLSPRASLLIDPDRVHPGMRLSGTGRADLVFNDPPLPAWRHTNQAAGREHRQSWCEHPRPRFEPECEATPLTCARHGNLRRLPAARARYSRHFGVEARLVLQEEIEILPTARQTIMDRSRRRSAGPAGVPAATRRHSKVKPAGLPVEVDLLDLPRNNQAQRLGEEHLDHDLFRNKRRAAIVLQADGGCLPPLAMRKRWRRSDDVKRSASPGLRPPLMSSYARCPYTNALFHTKRHGPFLWHPDCATAI